MLDDDNISLLTFCYFCPITGNFMICTVQRLLIADLCCRYVTNQTDSQASPVYTIVLSVWCSVATGIYIIPYKCYPDHPFVCYLRHWWRQVLFRPPVCLFVCLFVNQITQNVRKLAVKTVSVAINVGGK